MQDYRETTPIERVTPQALQDRLEGFIRAFDGSKNEQIKSEMVGLMIDLWANYRKRIKFAIWYGPVDDPYADSAVIECSPAKVKNS